MEHLKNFVKEQIILTVVVYRGAYRSVYIGSPRNCVNFLSFIQITIDKYTITVRLIRRETNPLWLTIRSPRFILIRFLQNKDCFKFVRISSSLGKFSANTSEKIINSVDLFLEEIFKFTTKSARGIQGFIMRWEETFFKVRNTWPSDEYQFRLFL